MNQVIFACIHNAGRSQMSAAFFNQLADPSKAIAISAGTNPGPRVHRARDPREAVALALRLAAAGPEPPA